jgi:hypothetical protein
MPPCHSALASLSELADRGQAGSSRKSRKADIGTLPRRRSESIKRCHYILVALSIPTATTAVQGQEEASSLEVQFRMMMSTIGLLANEL